MSLTTEEIEKVKRIKKALPSGGIQEIANRTGLEYQLVYNSFVKCDRLRWDCRHDRVIVQAELLLKERGIVLME